MKSNKHRTVITTDKRCRSTRSEEEGINTPEQLTKTQLCRGRESL